MYLKQIEIVGFKSFADKSTIVLTPGVTGVVGPNGSGKSNIADAIRWVLGEQSVRNLRGSKMEDVIFAGSELRRPTNLCEVSLVLDNTDNHLPVVFDEVTITRRVFRSGESEYYINRQPCRLKDIHELFMDTGLGREAYSIIGQGKIEEMLSTRAEDRRGPFEDAAGIVKFKHRRKEAERKLDETQANLVRVEDILAELEEQVGPLEKEKERAEKYREMAEHLEEVDITLLVVEIDKLSQRFKETVSGVEAGLAARDAAALAVTEAEAAWQQERQALERLNSQVEVLQQNYVSYVEQRQKQQGDMALLEQELAHIQETAITRTRQHEENLQELEALKAKVGQFSDAFQHVEASLTIKSSELEVAAESTKEQHRDRLTQEIDDLNAEFIEVNHRAATLRNELKMLEEQSQSEAGRLTRFEQDEAKWRAQVEEAERSCQDIERHLAELSSEMEHLAEQIRHFDALYEEALALEANSVTELHQLQAEIQSLSSRLELLRDLEEGYDGYALGVRTVMQQVGKGRLHGIHGTVAELIRVQKSFETAIETALGGSMQNVVVDKESHAREAIALLKQRQAGRATFMPLEVIKSRRLRDAEIEKVQHAEGYVGVASDLVDTDARFRVAIEHLLGNVVVAQTLEQANALARALSYKVRIVTLQGDVVSPGGLMSGGHHARKGPGLLGRSRERADVEERLKGLRAKQDDLKEKQRAYRNQVSSAQEERKGAQQALEGKALARQELQANLRETEFNKQTAEERLEALRWEFEQLATDKDTMIRRQEQARAALADVEQQLTSISAQTAQKREALAQFERDQQMMQDKVTSLRIEVATLRQERETTKNRMEELTLRRARLEQQLSEWASVSEGVQKRIEEIQTRLEAGRGNLTELVDALDQSQADLDAARSRRLEYEAQVRSLEDTVSEKRKAFSDAEAALHRAQVSSERADADLAYALQKMGEAHGMTYEWAKSRYPLETTEEELAREAQRLRRGIAALGEVNLGAIDEYARLSERVAFLVQQRDDLVTAQDKLNELITEIDTEMAQRFLETFEQIQREFQRCFQVLFNGGEANLQLTAPDDPLTTGIDVVAKPPGKKLQNLNLLSGGERALTAMALLFAILRVRPVPFCVLDEVEAALDEANVSRFAQQLKVFSAETQFIVITHRRGTMEEADALYGVTMPEFGVSSLVSVRLTDDLDFESA